MFFRSLVVLSGFALLTGCGGTTQSAGSSSPGPAGTLVPDSGTSVTVPTLAPTATAFPASAYTAKVQGTVTDAKSHKPLAGAIIRVAASSRTARTDSAGHYSVAFPAGAPASLIVHEPGYIDGLSVGKLDPHKSATANFKLIKQSGSAPPIPPMPGSFGSK